MPRGNVAALLTLALLTFAVTAHAGGPRQDVLPSGTGWYCFTAQSGSERDGACFRTKANCDNLLARVTPNVENPSACEFQVKAAVFTYYSVMNDAWFWSASPETSFCKVDRKAFATDDFTNLSTCQVVGKVAGRPANRKLIPKAADGWYCYTYDEKDNPNGDRGACFPDKNECETHQAKQSAKTDKDTDVSDCVAYETTYGYTTPDNRTFGFPTLEGCQESVEYSAGSSACVEVK